jgi:hypothetical protein
MFWGESIWYVCIVDNKTTVLLLRSGAYDTLRAMLFVYMQTLIRILDDIRGENQVMFMFRSFLAKLHMQI